MNRYGDKDRGMNDDLDGQNTMAVLNTLSGGEDALAEGEPLGLDPNADKSKLSGSTLAVGVVIVLAIAALFGMRMTLGAIAGDSNPSEAMAAIDTWIKTQEAAVKQGKEGPIKAPNDESKKVLDELKQDPTKKQVPADEVKTDPFDLSNIVKPTAVGPNPTPGPSSDPRAVAIAQANTKKQQLKVDSISGKMAFINGDLYRVGDKIGDGYFILESIEGLKCNLKTTDQFGISVVIEYK